jgi:LysM repeat protein
MNKRSSALARVVAVATLLVALIVLVVVIAGALGGSDSSGTGKHGKSGKAHHASRQQHNTPATYEVESGDTLISIAHRNGVTVAQIEALNPEVDPQILIAGETLKLK